MRKLYANKQEIEALLKLWGRWSYARTGLEFKTKSAGLAGADEIVEHNYHSVFKLSDETALKIDAIISKLKSRDEVYYNIARLYYLKRRSIVEIEKALGLKRNQVYDELRDIRCYVMGQVDGTKLKPDFD